MTISSFFFQVRHQLKHDMRLVWLPAMLFWITRFAAIEILSDQRHDYYRLQNLKPAYLTLCCVGIWIIYALVRANAPLNSNTASLTRPLGGFPVLTAKLAALFLLLVLPWVAGDAVLHQEFGNSPATWLILMGCSSLLMLLIGTVITALTSLAGSRRQLWLMGILLTAVLVALGNRDKFRSVAGAATGVSAEQGLTAAVVLSLAALCCLWLTFVKRSRWLATSVLTVGGLAWLLIAESSSSGAAQEKSALLTRKDLKLYFGQTVPSRDERRYGFTRNVQIAGLQDDEVATLFALAPVEQSKLWPPPGALSDYDPALVKDHGSDVSWMKWEHLPTISRQYPDTGLWVGYYHHRKKRPVVTHQWLEQFGNAPKWRMRIALHRVCQLYQTSMRDWWQQPVTLVLEEGIRMRLPAVKTWNRSSQLNVKMETVQLGARPIYYRFGSPALDGSWYAPNFVMIFQNSELRENAVRPLSYYENDNPKHPFVRSPWIAERNIPYMTHPPLPGGESSLSGVTQERWIDSTEVQIWGAEFMGMVDFELNAEQVGQIAEPQDD